MDKTIAVESCKCLFEHHEYRPLRISGRRYRYHLTVELGQNCSQVSFPEYWGKNLEKAFISPGNTQCPFFFLDGRLVLRVPDQTRGIVSFDLEYEEPMEENKQYQSWHSKKLFKGITSLDIVGTTIFSSIPKTLFDYHTPRWHHFKLRDELPEKHRLHLKEEESIEINNCSKPRQASIRKQIKERQRNIDSEGAEAIRRLEIPELHKDEQVEINYYIELSLQAKLWLTASLLLGLLGCIAIVGSVLNGLLSSQNPLSRVRDIVILSATISGILFAIRSWFLFQYIEILNQKRLNIGLLLLVYGVLSIGCGGCIIILGKLLPWSIWWGYVVNILREQ